MNHSSRRTFLMGLGVFSAFGLFNWKPAKVKQTASYIELGAGEFSTPIVLGGSLRAVYGQGEGITILKPPAGTKAIVRNHAGSGYDSEFNVGGLTIRGDNQSSSGVEIIGNAVANRVNNTRVRDVCFENLDVGLKVAFGVNVITSNCKYIACNRGQYFHEAADIRMANISTQLCKDFGTLITGQTLPYNEGVSAVGLVDNGSRVGMKVSHYDYLWLAACSFSSAKENAVIGEAVHNLSWASGEVSNTLGQGSGILTDGDCRRWMLSNILFDNITLFGIVLRGKYHNLSDSHFVNVANVPVYLEATDCKVHGITQETNNQPWAILEASGANRNRVYDCATIGSITLTGAQSKQYNNN